MKLQQFNGGESSRLAPHLIAVNEAVTYINCDNEDGTLKPSKLHADAGIAVSEFATYFIAQAEWVSSATNRDYVEFQDRLYWTDGTGVPQKYDGTNVYNAAITPATTAPTVVATEGPEQIDSVSLTDNTSAGDLPELTKLYYKIVNVDSVSGIEADSEEFSVSTGAGGTHQIVITDLSTVMATSARIYRKYEGTYRLLTTFAGPSVTFNDDTFDISANAEFTVSDGATTGTDLQYVYTFVNSTDGAESGPSEISAETTVQNGKVTVSAIEVSSDPQVDIKRIYRIGGGLTVFSLVAEVSNATTSYADVLKNTEIPGDAISTTGYTQAPTGLQFLTEAYATLFAALGPKLYFTEAGEPYAWSTLNFLDFDQDITGIGAAANGLLVMTRYRTYLVTGTGPATFTQQPLGGDQGCIEHKSIVKHAAMLLWASTDGICTSVGNGVQVLTKKATGKLDLAAVNAVMHDEVYYLMLADKSIFAIDFRYGGIIKRFTTSLKRLIIANDKLYGFSPTTLSLHELFTGENDTLVYLSPELTEGEYTNNKTYKNIHIKSTGELTVSVYVDGVIATTRQLTGDDSHQLKVKNEQMRGFKIQFGITGTGTVQEINYDVTGND